jgi:AraC-like DNA-binding protein
MRVALDAVLRTDDLPVAERFAYWRDVTSRMVAPVETRSDQAVDFRASARLMDLGAVQVSRVVSSSYVARRTPKLIRQSDPELLQLSLNLRGRSGVTQARRDVTLGARDMVLYDTSHPFEGRALPDDALAEGFLVAFPRTLLPVPENVVKGSIPVRLTGDRGVGVLLSQFIEGLTEHATELRAADRARMATILLDLLTATIAQQSGADFAIPPSSRRHTLLLRIHTYIAQHLSDPYLSPTTIAAACHISTRYLHTLFQQQGDTVAGWIRDRRLDRCQHDLADPHLRSLPVSAIAARWGFPDAAAFSRAFRAAYGVPPTVYRRLTAPPGHSG